MGNNSASNSSSSSSSSGAWNAAGSIIGGALGAAGGLFGSKKSSNSAKWLLAQQTAWERERAQNAHQWEVQDLMKAGLNPILSAGGSGATTSGVSGAMPDTSGYNKSVDAVNSAITLKRTNAEIENLKATTNKTNVESGLLTPQAEAEIREKNSNTALNSAKGVEAKANAKYQNRRTSGNWKDQAYGEGRNIIKKITGY